MSASLRLCDSADLEEELLPVLALILQLLRLAEPAQDVLDPRLPWVKKYDRHNDAKNTRQASAGSNLA